MERISQVSSNDISRTRIYLDFDVLDSQISKQKTDSMSNNHSPLGWIVFLKSFRVLQGSEVPSSDQIRTVAHTASDSYATLLIPGFL
jgi:hypothetical protein